MPRTYELTSGFPHLRPGKPYYVITKDSIHCIQQSDIRTRALSQRSMTSSFHVHAFKNNVCCFSRNIANWTWNLGYSQFLIMLLISGNMVLLKWVTIDVRMCIIVYQASLIASTDQTLIIWLPWAYLIVWILKNSDRWTNWARAESMLFIL